MRNQFKRSTFGVFVDVSMISFLLVIALIFHHIVLANGGYLTFDSHPVTALQNFLPPLLFLAAGYVASVIPQHRVEISRDCILFRNPSGNFRIYRYELKSVSVDNRSGNITFLRLHKSPYILITYFFERPENLKEQVSCWSAGTPSQFEV